MFAIADNLHFSSSSFCKSRNITGSYNMVTLLRYYNCESSLLLSNLLLFALIFVVGEDGRRSYVVISVITGEPANV